MTLSQNLINFYSNQNVFLEGDAGDCAYFIEKGRVLVYIVRENKEIPISILGVGEIFGEMSLIDNQTRSACVRAIEDVQLSAVNKNQLIERISSADSVVQLLVKVLLKRIRRTNTVQFDKDNSSKTIAIDYFDTEIKSAMDRLKLEYDIFEAFNNREFVVNYQPIVDLASLEVVGCEALLRWTSQKHGVVSPDIFMDLIEKSSMVIPVGEWILEQTIKDLKEIQKKFSKPFVMSINVSSKQLSHEDFVQHLDQLVEKENILAHQIKLELTERIMLEGNLAIEALEKCRTRGYGISIDDFGTGFSSLQYLSQMPIDFLKIDRSFVKKMNNDKKSMAVVSSIIHLAKALGLKLIAEGIETEKDLSQLKQLGVDWGQGYLFSKALPLKDFQEFIEKVPF